MLVLLLGTQLYKTVELMLLTSLYYLTAENFGGYPMNLH